jgi:hypothetical protein
VVVCTGRHAHRGVAVIGLGRGLIINRAPALLRPRLLLRHPGPWPVVGLGGLWVASSGRCGRRWFKFCFKKKRKKTHLFAQSSKSAVVSALLGKGWSQHCDTQPFWAS